jgi:hypothetical protein
LQRIVVGSDGFPLMTTHTRSRGKDAARHLT